MKVAIIGANSFIGKSLANKLLSNSNVEVSLFSRTANRHVLSMDKYFDFSEKFFEFDIIYYLASDTIPVSSWFDPLREITGNLIPFIEFMNVTITRNVKKVIYVSSAGTVYGASSLPLNEDSAYKPYSPYGINKLTIEHYLAHYQKISAIAYDVFRVSNVFGEGQNIHKGLGFVNTLLHNVKANRPTIIFGNGQQIRNFIYVEDVVKVLILAKNDLDNSRILNLSSDDNISLLKLVEKVENTIKEKCEIIFEKERESDNPCIMLDNSKLKAAFPNFQFTTLENSLIKTFMTVS